MLEISPEATAKVSEFFRNREISPIRIFLNQCGCGGPGLAMALDEPSTTDDVFEIEGFTYIIDKTFYEKAKPIAVSHSGQGFKLDCALDFGPSTCASGSCGSAGTYCS